MKKTLTLICISVLIAIYATPTIADVKIGGIIFTDVWYEFKDKENSGTKKDLTKFRIQIPNISRLYGKWTNEEKNSGMYIEFGIDGNGVKEREVVTRHACGWWQVNPNLKITAGQTVTGLSPLNPQQLLGTENGKINLIGGGFGDVYAGRIPLLKFTLTPSKEFQFDFAISDPDIQSAGFTDEITWGTIDSTLPRVDISAVIKAGPLTIYPGIMFANKTFADAPNNADDSISTYVVSLAAKANVGPICIKGEINIGQNWGNQDLLSIGLENKVYGGAVAIGNNQIENTDMYAGWLDVGIPVGVAEIHTILGIQNYANDMQPGTTKDDFDQTCMMFGFSVPIKVTKNFKVRPELILYDLGERESQDRGKYLIAGVQFQASF
ncbi:hypothetical protein MHK_008240 [Candidatus Magnetomorum sp. HK-1]|nr:hypothetical protein MHK_008240 [Candidatus Magnetomorum sp. HK-1]